MSFLFLRFYTFNYEYVDITKLSVSEFNNIYYLNAHPKFNLINGLYMFFIGIMFIGFILVSELYLVEVKIWRLRIL